MDIDKDAIQEIVLIKDSTEEDMISEGLNAGKNLKDVTGKKHKSVSPPYSLRQRVQIQKGIPSVAVKNKFVHLEKGPSSLPCGSNG